jgi:hypothetical protein
VLLNDGRVLVVGGIPVDATVNNAVPVTELFHPDTNAWSLGPTLQPAWFRMTATLLSSGKVLLFGGENAEGFPEPSVLLYE